MAEMRVLVIPDKFKGSLTGSEVIAAIKSGVEQVSGDIEVDSVIASDGGDGFLDSIRQANQSAENIEIETSDPLGKPIKASFLFDRTRKSAYVEMACASGMVLLTPEQRDPTKTSTLGTGTLIREAVDQGAKSIYVGLGGSATNDGGIGIATAMGYRFLDANGDLLDSIGENLARIVSIEKPCLPEVNVFAINDVRNPLCGPEGAAHVYGPQKGADPEMVASLDAGLDHLQSVVRQDLGIDASLVPGSGAAGGTGYGLHVFLNAEFLSGIEFVLSLVGAEERLMSGDVDLIITGEGRIDDQTSYGKLVDGVAQVGKKFGVPVVAICGLLDLQTRSVQDLGLEQVVQIHQPENPVEYTMRHAADLVTTASERLINERMS